MNKVVKLLTFIFISFSYFLNAQTPQEVMNQLMEGNDRFVQDALEHPNRDQERRAAIVAKQYPIAVIVGCSDSRVSPEIIFDQGVGDLFVVRVAGNVIGPLELDSIEYGVLHLRAKVVLIVGHENCGAVDAVVENNTKDIEAVAKLIQPAVQEAKKSNPSNLLEFAIKTNALRMKDATLKSSVIQKFLKDNKVAVHAAYYHLESGSIELLDNEPIRINLSMSFPTIFAPNRMINFVSY